MARRGIRKLFLCVCAASATVLFISSQMSKTSSMLSTSSFRGISRALPAGVAVAGVLARTFRVLTRRSQKVSAKEDPWIVYENLPLELRKDPPLAKKIPHDVPFGEVKGEDRGPQKTLMNPPVYRKDDYFWLRDDKRKSKDVIDHLKAENAYTNYKTHHLRAARENIFKEMLSHVKETDQSVPVPRGGYEYYRRNVEGLSYPIRCRRKKGDTKEQIILDENEIAKGLKHCDIRAYDMSESQDIMAYTIDDVGDEMYTIVFKNLNSGKMLPDKIPDTAGGVMFCNDDETVIYTTVDEAKRPDKVWMHKLGRPLSEAKLLYEENDTKFRAGYDMTSSHRYLILSSFSGETTEISYIDLKDEKLEKKCIRKRETGVIVQSIDHQGDYFYMVTNIDGAKAFKLVRAKIDGKEKWGDLFPLVSGKEDVKVDNVKCFEKFIAIQGREAGFSQIWTFSPDDMKGSLKCIEFENPMHTVEIGSNREFNTSNLRLTYDTLTTPERTYLYSVPKGELELLKEKEVPNYDPKLYETKRVYATSSVDGKPIPMSFVYRRDLVKDTPAPLHLYGYGSYEISIDPYVSPATIPLLDRGVIYVVAHVRGGGEMGRVWYESAKYKDKTKTFTDFVDCSKYLLDKKYTTNELMSMEGRSAGGLLVGAVINMAPNNFKAALAGVPFVDVMNTMSDPSIPLTSGEWEEWGNPNTKKGYDDILVYSPYDNIKKQKYPTLFITAGLHDPRVGYWEPAKWAAKLREYKTDDNPVLVKMDLNAGHFSASDRYKKYWERSLDMCFVLDQLGCLSASDLK